MSDQSQKPPGQAGDQPLLNQILARLIRVETRQVKQMAAQGLNPDGSVCDDKKEDANARS